MAKKYIRYYLTAGNRHSVHSPYIFTLVEEVLNKKAYLPAYEPMELLRTRLLRSADVVQVTDLGAGSLTGASNTRRVRDIARHAAKPARFGQLFYRLVQHLGARNVLELGTSLGLSTAYMASAGATVHTIEGCPNIAALARMNFSSLGLDNIRQHTGNFDTVLAGVLEQMPSPDIVYIDGNHREEPTVRYFEQCLPYLRPGSIVIFDDVHWTEGMERAWATVQSHPAVTTTIDLFFIGIAFVSPDFKAKQHFTIKF